MKTAANVDEFWHRRSVRWTHATTDTKVRWTTRTVTSILCMRPRRGLTKEAKVRPSLYTTIGAAVAALALASATLTGQHAHSRSGGSRWCLTPRTYISVTS